jgi:hypothetical protein
MKRSNLEIWNRDWNQPGPEHKETEANGSLQTPSFQISEVLNRFSSRILSDLVTDFSNRIGRSIDRKQAVQQPESDQNILTAILNTAS